MPSVFPPSRGEKSWRALSYLFTAGTGLYVLLAPAVQSWGIETRLGIASIVWAIFMLTALPAAVATWCGRYRIEAILLPLFGSALLVALINTWVRATDDPTLIGRASASTALLCLFVARLINLHRITKVTPPSWTTTGR